MGGGRTKATIRSITMQLPVDIIYRGKLYPSDNFLRLLNREMTETNMLDANAKYTITLDSSFPKREIRDIIIEKRKRYDTVTGVPGLWSARSFQALETPNTSCRVRNTIQNVDS